MSHTKKKSGRSLTKLALFDERDKIHPRNETYEGLENFAGLVKKRGKTDFLFLLFYILCNIGMTVLLYLTVTTVDFKRLGYGNDFRGDVCGKPDTTVANKPYVYYQDPVNTGTIGMCVSKCPDTDSQVLCFYDVDGETILDDYCYQTYITTSMGRFCVPPETGHNRTIIEGHTRSPLQILKLIASDLFTVYDIIALCLIVTVVLGMLYIITVLIDKTRKVVLWIFTIGAGLLAANIFYLFFSDFQQQITNGCLNGKMQSGCLGYRGYFTLAVGGLIIIVLLGYYIYLFKNREKVKLAFVKGSGQVLMQPIRQTKTMILFLIIQFIFQLIIIAHFYAIFIIAMASGNLTLLKSKGAFPNTTYFDIKSPSYITFVIVFYCVMFLWNLGNTLAFGKMIITSAVSTWYFTKEKSILDLPVLRGFKYTFRYHIGTIAYGSICITLNWPLKSFFGMIKERLKKIRNRKSRTFRFWMSTCNISLTLYEFVLKYVSNKNFMQTAIFGEEFCVSGVRVFYLKYRNESRLRLLKTTIGYYLMIGKIFVTLAVTALSYNLILLNDKTPLGRDLTYIEFSYAPTLFILLITLFTSQTFTSLFDVVIDTVFFCFICDEEMYTGKQRFAEPELREFMDQFGKEAKKQDDELDVRARPKQFKAEDEKALINDNIFVTEKPKVINDKSEEEEDHNEDADDKSDDTHAYKALNIDHEVSAISDNAISVGGLTSRSQVQSKTPDKSREEQPFAFKGINFTQDDNTHNAKEDENEDEEEEEEDDEEQSEGSEDEDDSQDKSEVFKVQKSNKQEMQKKDTRLNVGNKNTKAEGGSTLNFAGNKDIFKIASDESEEEEDLEQNVQDKKSNQNSKNYRF